MNTPSKGALAAAKELQAHPWPTMSQHLTIESCLAARSEYAAAIIDQHANALANELAAALQRSQSMLKAVAWDIEDAFSLSGMREKYVTAVLSTSDDARTALANYEAAKAKEAP